MSRITQRKLKSITFYIICWFLLDYLFLGLHFYGTVHLLDPTLYVNFFQFSLLIGLSHGIYDVVILQDDKDHRPVWAALIVRSFYFISTIVTNIVLCILVWSLDFNGELINEESISNIRSSFQNPDIQAFMIFAFCGGYIITFVRSVHKKHGSRVFINAILGKYQEPKEEDRIFMFVDLRHSTQLAEELGNLRYSHFLMDYYHLLSNCCEENWGEIYQIAGDGVFLTWPVKSCLRKPRVLLCFHDLKECFARTAKNFDDEYGVHPEFKAAAHCGKVIITEVGNFGSEMAYHGDAMNTTSRLQDLCTPLDKDFILSEELLKKLPGTDVYYPQPMGSFELKGKKNEISVFSLDFPLDNQK